MLFRSIFVWYAFSAILIGGALGLFVAGCSGEHAAAENALTDYRDGAFRAAADGFRLALGTTTSSSQDAVPLLYNLGTAEYRLNDYGAAAAELMRASGLLAAEADGGSDELRFRVDYNLGNAHFRRSDYAQSIGAYRRALLIRPGDAPSKHNLELALMAQRRELTIGGGRDSETPRPTPEAGRGEPTPSPERPRGMSQDEAKRLLDMLGGDDTRSQRRRTERMAPPTEGVGQDW